MSMTVIRRVEPESPAARAGLRPGEMLLKVGENPIHDILDYKFYTYDARVLLTVKEPDGAVRTVPVRKAEGEDLGVEFETYLMDRARSCANQCIFCFVDQMPKGMRPSLYFKDDDARLSFLMGNYLTLTNLSQREIARIISLRISPINISVHTTNPQLRAEMLGHRRAGEGAALMHRFAEAKITMNCQIVACPGMNDGAELERTMGDLAQMYPSVHSVSVVPVGLTKFREGLYPLRPYTREEAAGVIDQVEAFGRAHKKRTGTSLIWCSDELYLLAERNLPEEEYYEEFAQLENGVGMLRLLRSEFARALELMEAEEMEGAMPFTIATGVSAAPFLREMVDMARKRCDKIKGTVYAIRNDFFGETVVVSGLVTGGDLIAQLQGKPLAQRLLIPINMLRAGERVFLDDVTIQAVEEALHVTVTTVGQDGYELCEVMFSLASARNESGCSPREEEYYSYNPPLR